MPNNLHDVHGIWILNTFALLDWVKRDLVIMKRINTADNYADSMTKSLGRQLRYQHTDYILGKIIPSYAAAYSV